jgi:hypothetical protein
MDEAQPGVSRGVDDLPPGKVKAWLVPNVPEVVRVANSNETHNVAHRDVSFQVKLAGSTKWVDEALTWGEDRTYDTGLMPLAVRNNGRVNLTIMYE